MDTLAKILHLIMQKGIEQKKFAADLGIQPQVVSDWKSKKSKSYMKYINAIAEYFNVTTDYLLWDNESVRYRTKLEQLLEVNHLTPQEFSDKAQIPLKHVMGMIQGDINSLIEYAVPAAEYFGVDRDLILGLNPDRTIDDDSFYARLEDRKKHKAYDPYDSSAYWTEGNEELMNQIISNEDLKSLVLSASKLSEDELKIAKKLIQVLGEGNNN